MVDALGNKWTTSDEPEDHKLSRTRVGCKEARFHFVGDSIHDSDDFGGRDHDFNSGGSFDFEDEDEEEEQSDEEESGEEEGDEVLGEDDAGERGE